MIRQITLGKYVNQGGAAREINRQISGETLLPFCPVPNGTTVYFDDESNRAIPLISHIPIIKPFKEFTVNIPAIKTNVPTDNYHRGWNLDFLIMNEKDCFEIPHKVYRLRQFCAGGTSVSYEFFTMPSNVKKVRIYTQGYYTGSTNGATMGIYSYDKDFALSSQPESGLLAIISTQGDGTINTPPIEIPPVDTLAFCAWAVATCGIRLAIEVEI